MRDPNNPVAQAYFTIFDNSPETLLATLLVAFYPVLERLPFSWIKRSDDAKKVIINAASELISAKSTNNIEGDKKDILDCMIQENKRLERIGEEGLSKQEMICQILTFLAAGYVSPLFQVSERTNFSHETTSTALVWALYELSEHPDVQTRLREEIHLVLGKSYNPLNPPTYDQLEQMKYLNNVCREVLRIDPPGTSRVSEMMLNPTVPITARQAVEDDIYEGVKIPKATLIHFPKLVINMHPSIWGPDAEEFRPDRWDNIKDAPSTQFLTFQHGASLLISTSRT